MQRSTYSHFIFPLNNFQLCNSHFEEELEWNLASPPTSPNCVIPGDHLHTAIHRTAGWDGSGRILLKNVQWGFEYNEDRSILWSLDLQVIESTKEVLSNKLVMYEKGSKTCQVKVIYDENWTESYTNLALYPWDLT